MTNNLLVVVEGIGDVDAVRVLTRRVLHEDMGIFDCAIDVHRRNCLDHLRANDWQHFRRFLQVAFLSQCPVLWTLDCDDGCALHIADEMSQIALETGIQQPIGFALWVREFESLFLCDLETTRNKLAISDKAQAPPNPEGIRGVKGWLTSHMPHGQRYKETIDQVKVTSSLSLERVLNHSRSGRHFRSVLQWLLEQEAPALYPLNT